MQLIGSSVMICWIWPWHGCSGILAELFPVLDLHFLTFFCLFPIHTLLQCRNKLCMLFVGRTALSYDTDNSCLSNTYPWSINVKLFLSWQFPQAAQRDGHLLHSVLSAGPWDVTFWTSLVLAVCSEIEKGRREGYACPERLCSVHAETVSKCTLQTSA